VHEAQHLSVEEPCRTGEEEDEDTEGDEEGASDPEIWLASL
jgi:hypothetical protein